MLSHVSLIEFAAARYVLGEDGRSRVHSVKTARRTVQVLDDLDALLPWLRAQNASEGLNIWVRPASSLEAHLLLMLDDLPLSSAQAVAHKYRCAAVETSSRNHQVWLVANQPLSREQRQDVAKALCRRIGSDPGAISEPRWGRLPGFKQMKPEKPSSWTNLLSISTAALFNPTPYLVSKCDGGRRSLPAPGAGGVPSASGASGREGVDMSRREFAFACHALRAGVDPAAVEQRIAEHVDATDRRKSRDYAARTVAAAQRAVG
jgi:hypothetical protein